MTERGKLPLVVLISGSGSNLQAIIDAAHNGLPVDIRAVISNRPGVNGLKRAEQAGIPIRVLDHKEFTELKSLIDNFQPELVILAGFMRILTSDFVRHYAGRLFNIHPSLLPKFRGLHTHQRALDAGEKLHGASVHFVTEELDGGPVIVQAQVSVLSDDDADRLAARVLEREHQIYPLAIDWFAAGRLSLNAQGKISLDGMLRKQPIVFQPDQAIG